jgi:hypothetical protein
MQDQIVVVGAQESAEIIEEAKTFACSCGFGLQVSGGIALNDGFNVIVNSSHKCPKCENAIEVKN